MKTIKSLFALVVVLLATVSCNKDFEEITQPQLEKHTCEMKLEGSLVGYESNGTRAEASETTWEDGSVIYLRMESPMGITTGEAVYNASKDVWTLSYYGSLYEGEDYDCSALYVEDEVSYNNTLFTVDNGTAIYEDLAGSYVFEGGDLIVTANLKPRTGRIRFTGDAGKVLKVYGITHYTTYDIGTNIYTTTTEPFKITVGEDGYTPYFYGYFTNEDAPNVKVWIDAKEAYTRFCSQNIFNAGQSGVMTIPTEDAHNGWADGLHFNINGAQFKMVAVEGGTFTMGDPESTDEYYTAHKVTLTGYCIGETEVTNLLYAKSNNTTSSSPNRPYDSSDVKENVIKKVNDIENVSFDLPTEAQWEFAARGGIKSKGYKYSGSDNIDDVCWYKGNSGSLKDVKLKLPNELGLYDMSGNAYEQVKDRYAPYATINQVDPIVTGTGNRVYRGGVFNGEAKYCTIYYRSISNIYWYGSRLALNWND
ncbi:MAG: SUMF1/EgtB/PvdO family nonheme iron enzyme [Alistipes sp.]|nr:SUMF1/EgtB/PvdO family nonheme iron enzyme [Alistipes sp.]